MILFVVSGVTFVSGALGVEMFGARHAEVYGKGTLFFAFISTCEEFLEMLGIVIFIYTLLTYIVSQFKFFELSVNEPGWHETNTHTNETSTANAKKRHVWYSR